MATQQNTHDVDIKNIDYGIGQKTFQSYVAGFFFSLFLTLIAFGLVLEKVLTAQYLYISLAILAIAQLMVQSYCFLRLNARPESRWTTTPFLFSLFIIAVLVGGSIWIMYNLNYNMYH